MMKFLFFMIFMTPLCFVNYWFLFSFFPFFFFFFLLNYTFDNQFIYLGYLFGIDQLSYLMILLSIYICMLMYLASEKVYYNSNYLGLFSSVILILFISLFILFMSLNFFMFYLFFEVSLIPTLFLILGWGYQPERIQAGVYLLFYTIFASLPMLVCLFFLYEDLGSLVIMFFSFNNYSFFYYLFMVMVFMVKIPMFMVHLWLPKAHVEAPVSGSMILAGVMLKLGGYGIIRVMPLFLKVISLYGYLFMSISLIGGVIVSLICLRQSDMKSLIAYSSVSHMGLVVGGLMTMSYWGMIGSLMMMLAHGLCSSGLFCLANISYERLSSRSLYMNKGLINLMPSLSLCWFLLISSNMAAPPSLNLVSEIMLFNSMVFWSSISMLMLMLMSFFSAVYSLFLYSFTQHGKLNNGLYSFSMSSLREFLLLFMHWLPLNLMILKIDYYSLWV